MRHHAQLVSRQSDERVDVTLDVADGHVEMFVAEMSVGRWPIGRFIGAPGDSGFDLAADGDSWTVEPRDRPLFEADTVPRLPRRSRAYFINRYPRVARTFDAMRGGGLRRHLTRGLAVSGLTMVSFGFGVIAGRFRLDGRSLSTGVFVGLVLAGSVAVTKLLSLPAQSPTEAIRPDADDRHALDRLTSILRFQEPVPPAPTLDTARDTDLPEEREPPTSAPTDLESSERAKGEDDDSPTKDRLAPVNSQLAVRAAAVELPLPAISEEPDFRRDRLGWSTDPEPVVDRGRIHLPAVGKRQSLSGEGFEREGFAEPVFVIEVEAVDDLTTIHGIGPAFAALLNDLGIHSFRQLASIDEDTLGHLREQMGPLAGRIERDGWIEGAVLAQLERTDGDTHPSVDPRTITERSG